MIETAEQPVVVYTDHASTVGIASQSSLNTTSIEKLNLKLPGTWLPCNAPMTREVRYIEISNIESQSSVLTRYCLT